MMSQFVLLGNDSPTNRGCEAISRGTAEILFNCFPGSTITDAHFRTGDAEIAEPVSSGSSVCAIQFPRRWSPPWLMFQLGMRCSETLLQEVLFSSLKEKIKNSTAVLSVGGDNYSLDYGLPKRFIAMDRYVKKLSKPVIIWGASIGPFSEVPYFEKSIALHLKSEVDLILVREDASLAYLESLGVAANVQRVGDPAFVMKPEPCSQEKIGFVLPEKFIALSTGAMMAKYVTNGNLTLWYKCCKDIILRIRKDTDLPVVLIPHVGVDYDFFQNILKNCNMDEIYLVSKNLNAAEMKWVIGKSVLLIGSRMHATIAGFSSGVPVLSLAYSLKATGMNLEIYRHDDYILSKKEISVNSVLEKVRHIIDNIDKVRVETLAGAQHQKKLALNAGEIVKKYLLC